MMNIKHLEKNTSKSIRRSKIVGNQNRRTAGKTPCLRPIIQSRKQQGLQLLNRSHTLLKSTAVTLFPYRPHHAHGHQVPYIRGMFT